MARLRSRPQRCKRSQRSYPNRVPGSLDPRLPDFLVIGAMKAGTTTLYRDLRQQPAVFLPDKETNALLADDPAKPFSEMAVPVDGGMQFGEVCPDYTKPGLGEQAAKIAAELYQDHRPPRLVYLVREPLARLRSHHYFLSSQQGGANPGGMTADIEASLRDFPELVETSCYASRLQPWLDAFGSDSVLVLRFEDYVAKRTDTLDRILAFVGVRPNRVESPNQPGHFNPSDSRPIATPGWHRFRKHPLYRKLIRPCLSLETRDRIRSWLLPKPPPPPAPPSEETLDRLKRELQPEVEAISRIAGTPKPLWDLDDVIASIRASR